jgi:hypothetical protein
MSRRRRWPPARWADCRFTTRSFYACGVSKPAFRLQILIFQGAPSPSRWRQAPRPPTRRAPGQRRGRRAAERLSPGRSSALWGDSDGWPRTPEEDAARDAYYSACRDLSGADRYDYNTVVILGRQTAAEKRAVRNEKTQTRELARTKRKAARDP